MKINFAHVRHPATNGGSIDFAVFEAKATSNSESANQAALSQLTMAARGAGHKIDQSALAFTQNGQLRFYGSKNLVDFLAKHGLPNWTHSIEV